MPSKRRSAECYTPVPSVPPEPAHARRRHVPKPGYQPPETELWAIITSEIERRGDEDVGADSVHARLKIYDPLCLNERSDWVSAVRDCIGLLIMEG